jgi:threonine dehydratase
MIPSFRDVDLAGGRLASVIKPTPLIRSETLSRMLEAEVFIKPENLQKTGSFKIRGAYNRIVSLAPGEAARGVIAASAGNHGQALAYAATLAGVSATIVVPRSASIAKVEAIRGYGQRVMLEGEDYRSAQETAAKLRDETGAILVHAYNDPLVIAGQGTIGLEIARALPADMVFVPVGGGGLIAGIALALAELAANAHIIGVEAAGSPQLSASLAAGRAVSIVQSADTIADGLASGTIGDLPFEILRDRLSEVVAVDDFEIGEAVLLLLERMKFLAEGAGAAALAGAIKIRHQVRGRRVVLVISGGNIDMNLLDRIIGHGLVKVGRLLRVSVDLRDRPGQLAPLLTLIGAAGASVLRVDHDRHPADLALGSVRVILELETRGPDHIETIRRTLDRNGYAITTDR